MIAGEKGVFQAQSGRGGRKGCSPSLSCMPVDSATAYVRNGIASELRERYVKRILMEW